MERTLTKYDLEVRRGTVSQIARTLLATPGTLASLFADYTIPTGDFAGFRVGVDVRYVGRSFSDTAKILTEPEPEHVPCGAVMYYVHDNWRLAVIVTD